MHVASFLVKVEKQIIKRQKRDKQTNHTKDKERQTGLEHKKHN